jgi:di/tripeptidase
MNAPYPPASEAVDQHLSSSIDALRTTTEAGFSRVDSSIRELVTRGEFSATIQRLDARDDQIDTRVTTVSEHLTQKMDSGLSSVKSDMATQFTALRTEDDKRTTKTRWLLGTIVVAAGLAWQIVSRFLP